MSRDPVDRWRDLGSFIREQRSTARLSLRRLSELAGISNPYLSQIERGLRRPSADILQQIAKALRISAETLYVQAGILDPPDNAPDLVRHILADPHIGESQKQALVEIYLSFRQAHTTDAPRGAGSAKGADAGVANPADVANRADVAKAAGASDPAGVADRVDRPGETGDAPGARKVAPGRGRRTAH
jgi:transcriptional regulator with XRE-family HTH domain